MTHKNLLKMVVLSTLAAPNLFGTVLTLRPGQKLLAQRRSPICMGAIRTAKGYVDLLKNETTFDKFYDEAVEHLIYLRKVKGRLKCLRNLIGNTGLSKCPIEELEDEAVRLDLLLGNTTLNSSLLEVAISDLSSALRSAKSLMVLVEALSPSLEPANPPILSHKIHTLGLPKPKVRGVKRVYRGSV